MIPENYLANIHCTSDSDMMIFLGFSSLNLVWNISWCANAVYYTSQHCQMLSGILKDAEAFATLASQVWKRIIILCLEKINKEIYDVGTTADYAETRVSSVMTVVVTTSTWSENFINKGGYCAHLCCDWRKLHLPVHEKPSPV